VKAFTVTELPLRLHRVEPDPFLDHRWRTGREGERGVTTALPATALVELAFKPRSVMRRPGRGELAA
jgi:hypothetical protein